MLQQTRIAVVVPAYERFIAAFPSLRDLAAADQEQVLSFWSGLGYYSRARSLHAAARALMADGRSEFPRDYRAALELPGVGPYTAAAVTSIAYEKPHAAVDGNVTRVLSRLEGFASNASGYAALAQQLLDPEAPGEWNQLLMELGQAICVPKSPACPICPARRLCRAHRQGQTNRFPVLTQRAARERVALYAAVVRDDGPRFLLERGSFTYLPHLWLPPLRLTPPRGRVVAKFKHAIVHRDFEVQVFERVVSAERLHALAYSTTKVQRRPFSVDEIRVIGRSSLLTKTLSALDRSCFAATMPQA